MDKELEYSTVAATLSRNGLAKAEGKVRNLSLNIDMELKGFLPYSSHFVLDTINFNGVLKVTPYIVKYDNEKIIIPVTKYVKSNKEDVYSLTKYNILPINQLTNETLKRRLISYKNVPNITTASYLVEYLNKCGVDFLDKDQNGNVFCKGEYNPLLFYRDVNEIEFVADSYLCLCEYNNPLTGFPIYTAFPPDELFFVIPQNKDLIPDRRLRQFEVNEKEDNPFD